ncbi:MAG: potassium channel protein [Gammaproteobacteria bacterium]|nr:potassium channel protein [Gammaproteobacteria bacterium]
MSDIFFLVLRRLRAPLILLVTVYAIATLGMTLIPGVTPDGEPYRMNFFHAFYFVSFMGTTIGFGEIPYPFTDAQRAWVTVFIYLSVISWLYAIGTLLSLLQDTTFRHAIAQRTFRLSINRIDRPFYIICGYGETGMLVNRGLTSLGLQTVIIDYNPERTSSLELENLPVMPITLNADTTEPQNLVAAGINHPRCCGVLALTEKDHTNLQIAVSAKLMSNRVPVICRSEIEDEAENMASFGTNHIINPYRTFARRLSLLVHKPALHKVHNWFLNQHSREHQSERELPKGRWIICGYGRLGRAIHEQLGRDGIEMVLVDPNPDKHDASEPIIEGRGTEADTLQEAGISEASVIIASSKDDANNLSILITARQLNPDIYTIGRVSKEANQPLFVRTGCDYIMRRSQVVANESLTIISRPLVSRFLRLSNSISTEETEHLIERIENLTRHHSPITTRVTLNRDDAPALSRHLHLGGSLTVGQVSQHPFFPRGDGIVLLIQRGNDSTLLPDDDTHLEEHDDVLFCGKRNKLLLVQHLRDNHELVDSLINQNPHQIPLLRWWRRRHNALADGISD